MQKKKIIVRLKVHLSTSESFIRYIYKTAAGSVDAKGSGADETDTVMDDPVLQKIFIQS